MSEAVNINDICAAATEDGTLVFSHRRLPIVAVLAIAQEGPGKATCILAPIRVVPYDLGQAALVERARGHARNLQHKLRVLDALGICSETLSLQFRGGRVLFSHHQRVGQEVAWQFVGRCIREAERQLSTPVITQPDYDQKQYHRLLGGVLDSIDFKTVHDPSAIGTVACFKTVLRHYCLRQDISFGIVGVGELGSRILKLLRSTVKTNILVCDTDPNKVTTACETSGVLASTLARMIGNGLDAVIFCANSGSLSGATASSLAASQSVIAAGGPEAGNQGAN